MNNPTGLAISSTGELYIADTGNNRIRKVDRRTGLLTTVIGNGEAGDSGDLGPAINARLNKPTAIVFDHHDNLFIADTKNHKIRLFHKKSGRIATLAGNGKAGYCGDDSGRSKNACFNDPTGLGLDRLGRVYVADTDNQRIRRITINFQERRAEVKTVVGTGKRGYNGSNMDAWDVNLAYPGGMFISPSILQPAKLLTPIYLSPSGR